MIKNLKYPHTLLQMQRKNIDVCLLKKQPRETPFSEKYHPPFFTCPAADQLQKEQGKQQLFILYECSRNKHCRA